MPKKLGNILLVMGLMAGSFGLGAGISPLRASAQGDKFGDLLQVYRWLHSDYVEQHLNDTKLEYGAIRGMLATLGDPYTRFMDPQAFRQMQEEKSGEFSGVGIEIGLRSNKLTVIAPLDGTPAAKAGLRTGDVITAIDGKPTKNMDIEVAVIHIRGPKGSKVALTVQRGQAMPFTVSIVRDEIITEAVHTKALPGDIGYIRLSTFMNENATDEMRDALDKFKHKKGIILDLRGNPGGLLTNAVNIGSMFIKDGPILQIVGPGGDRVIQPATGDLVLPTDVPVVVLVDGGSASASEILSGALQDDHRAILIGTKTFGKGLVQEVRDLDDGAGVAITTNKYLTAGGHDINKKGIEPNIVVNLPKLTIEKDKDGKEMIDPSSLKSFTDTQLQRAEQYLHTEIAKAGR